MNTYKAIDQQTFTNGDYSIIPIRMVDRSSIMVWRNAQLDILRQGYKLTEEDQKRYFIEVIEPLFNQDYPNQLLFSYLKDLKLIGYGGLVNISWIDKRAEMSFLVDNLRAKNKVQYKEDMIHFIKLIKQLCFNILKFNRLFTETYAFREYHISILESEGFRKEGIMRQHVIYKDKFIDSIIHSILKKEYNEK